MGVVGLLGKLMKGSNNESISFLCSINRKKPVKKVEEVTSKYLDTLENMIKIKTSEKLFKVDSQDDIRQYYEFYNAVDKELKKLKKNCAAMEKIKKSYLEEMINDYNEQREVLKDQINFITNMKPMNDGNSYDMDAINNSIKAINGAIDAINNLRRNSPLLGQNDKTAYKKIDNGNKSDFLIIGEFLRILNEQTEHRNENVEKAKQHVSSLIEAERKAEKEKKINACKKEFTEKLGKILKFLGSKDIENIPDNLDDIYSLVVNVPLAIKINGLNSKINPIRDSMLFKDAMLKELVKSLPSKENFMKDFFDDYFNNILSGIDSNAEEKITEIKNGREENQLSRAEKNKITAITKNSIKLKKPISNTKGNIEKLIGNFIDKWRDVKTSFDELKSVKEGNFESSISSGKYENVLSKFITAYDEQIKIIKGCAESENYKTDNNLRKKALDPFKSKEKKKLDEALLKFNRVIGDINEEIRKYKGYLSEAKVCAKNIKDRINEYVRGYSTIFDAKHHVEGGKVKENELRNLSYEKIPRILTLSEAIIIFYKYIDGYEQNDFNIFRSDHNNNNNFIKSYLEEKDKLKLGFSAK